MTEATAGASLVGKQLDDVAGTAVGKIEGLLVDPESGAAEWIVVRGARFGGRLLVPARDAVAAVEKVWVPFDAPSIRSAPKAKGDLTQADEMELLRHYRIGGPAGRAAEIAERTADAPSAVER
jgi:sporulation protein YlmC with PRC-barrel domain